jgi:hypothetical protein
MFSLLLAISLLSAGRDGISLAIDGDRTEIDPGRSVFLSVTLKYPKDVTASIPDLRGRVRGFSLAEDFAEPVKRTADGSTVETVNWKLVPEPCAEVYKIAPFAVTASPRLLSSRGDDGKFSFVAGPVYFTPPPARDPVTGEMEADPKKDLPPLSWKLVGKLSLWVLGAGLLAAGCWSLVRYAARRIKEHRMSPIERALAELDRLLKKGLPGRGRYKDFYVELTMVVRRYVQRKYGIKAPNMTTEEFLAEFGRGAAFGGSGSADGSLRPTASVEQLKAFLESADMVKFAGVEATPEMADAATDSARGYLKGDDREEAK